MHISRTALVGLPSLDLGPRYAARTDIASYETRWLYLLLALRAPATSVAIVTSDRVPDWEVGYYLRLAGHAEPPGDRLLMLALEDVSRAPLAPRLRERPDLLARLREFAAGAEQAWSIPFVVTADDDAVSAVIDVPFYVIVSQYAADMYNIWL